MRNRRHLRFITRPKHSNMTEINRKQDITTNDSEENTKQQQSDMAEREPLQARHPTAMVNGNLQKFEMFILYMYGGYWLTYINMSLFTNPSAQAGYDTRSIFKQSLTGLNSEFSFS